MLLIKNDFISHSGKKLNFKIECDNLTDTELELIAQIYNYTNKKSNLQFSHVYGIPTGGVRIAHIFEKYKNENVRRLLIIDDVMTTGSSMRLAHQQAIDLGWKKDEIIGFVLFNRSFTWELPLNGWISPFFQLGNSFIS